MFAIIVELKFDFKTRFFIEKVDLLTLCSPFSNKVKKLQEDPNALKLLIKKVDREEVPAKKQKLDNQIEMNVNTKLDKAIESLTRPPLVPSAFINTVPVTGKLHALIFLIETFYLI